MNIQNYRRNKGKIFYHQYREKKNIETFFPQKWEFNDLKVRKAFKKHSAKNPKGQKPMQEKKKVEKDMAGEKLV